MGLLDGTMRQRHQPILTLALDGDKRGYAKWVRTLAPRVSLQVDVMLSPNRLLRNQANLLLGDQSVR